MRKKILHSDISLDIMPVVETRSRKCRICDEKLKMIDKMVVFDDRHIPLGYCCKYCKTVYGPHDVLVSIGDIEGSGVFGEG
jgi:hypothetical protein